MSDLRVIDGGKGTESEAASREKRNYDIATEMFGEFIRQMLRLLGGARNVPDLADIMVRFFDHIDEHQVYYRFAMRDAAYGAQEQIFERIGRDAKSMQLVSIVTNSLKLYAECLAEDNLSGARLEQRMAALHLGIEDFAEDYGHRGKRKD